MSLVRSGLVIALGVALLPADRATQQQMINQATEAANWAMTFCEREPGKCEQAARLLDVAREKALVAGSMALEATQKYAAGSTFAAAGAGADSPFVAALPLVNLATATPVQMPSRGTLRPDDLLPAWRGGKTR